MTQKTKPTNGLLADTRGGFMVIGLLMAVVSVGCLYYLIGIGDAIVVRNKMQDGADAAAFSGAIVHARGMNILALINIVMAAVVAVLVMLKLVSAACRAAITVLLGLSFLFPGAMLAVPPLRAFDTAVSNTAHRLKKPIMNTIMAGRKLARGVRATVPLAAQARVADFAVNTYSPPTQFGFVYPIYKALPTVDDEFSRLCTKAGEYAGAAIGVPIAAVAGEAGDTAADLLAKFTSKLANEFARYFCGKQGGSPPTIFYDRKTFLPRANIPDAARCADPNESSDAACARAGAQIERAKAAYDPLAGHCVGADRRACELLLRSARIDCRPDSNSHLKYWWWRQQRLQRVWRLERGDTRDAHRVVVVDERREFQAPTRQSTLRSKQSRPPCAPANEHTSWQSDIDQPVCEQAIEPPSIDRFLELGTDDIAVEFVSYTDVLGCLEVKRQTDKLADASDQITGDQAHSPQTMCNCAMLGEDQFQVRAIIVGDVEPFLRRAEHGVSIANLGRVPVPEVGALLRFARGLGRVSFAQAEYFYDGEHLDNPAEWLWHMGWQARMRRFHLSGSGWQCPQRTNSCPKPLILDCSGPGCSKGLRALGHVSGLILH